MTGKYDVYSLCGCGSGKKLKFCCADVVDDILKVGKLQEQGQLNMALQTLERIEKKSPGYPWTTIVKASILLETDLPEDAYHLVEKLLKKHSDHKLAIALRADAAFGAWGFDVAKPALYQTFYMGIENYPYLLSNLATNVALELNEERRYLAARQYLGLAMRLSSAEGQQQAYMALMEFDGDHKIPYPLRSVHKLNDYEGTSENTEIVARAEQFAAMGQWQAASLEYEKLSELDSENSSLWKNLGFCKAWDGREEEAAGALHKAATLTQNVDDAVELETVAQLLDLYTSGEETEFIEVDYDIKNIKQLTSALDSHLRFQRENNNNPSSTEYTILDRLPPESFDDPEMSLDDLSRELGGLVIYNDNDNQPEIEGFAVLTGLKGERLESSQEFFQEVAGESVASHTEEMTPKFKVKEYSLQLMTQQAIPSEIPIALKASLRQRLVKTKLEVEWATIPHFALDDKTPQEVSGDSDYRLRLTAAIYLLDATSEMVVGTFSVTEMLKRFNLSEPFAIEIDDNQPLHLLSNMQIHRLKLTDLTDEQLRRVLDRVRLTNHSPFVYLLLTEAISRPEFVENHLDMSQVYSTLTSICQGQNKVEESLKWVECGREFSSAGEGDFETVLQWDARKLSALIYQHDNTELQNHLRYMRDYYGHKVPQYLTTLEQTLTEVLGGPLPVSLTEGLEPVGSAPAPLSTEVWASENKGEQKPEEEKKLWLPGS